MKFLPPRRFSAAQVTAEFYRRARAAELEVWLDLTVKTIHGHKCRLDGVIVVGKDVACIIVCKSSANAARAMTKQKARYQTFGVPLVIVRGMDRIQAAVLEAKRYALGQGAQLSDEDIEAIGLGDTL